MISRATCPVKISNQYVSGNNSQPQDSKLTDTVTIITSVTNNQIVKTFVGADHQQLKFSPGSEFLASQQPVHDLQSLASVISGLEAELTKAIIHGLTLLSERGAVKVLNPNNGLIASQGDTEVHVRSLK